MSEEHVVSRLRELKSYVDRWDDVVRWYLRDDNPPLIIAFVARTVLHYVNDCYLTYDLKAFLGLERGRVDYGEFKESLDRACVKVC